MFTKGSVTAVLVLSLSGAGGAAAPSSPAAPADLPAPPDVAAAPPDATNAPSGLAWKVLTPAHGGGHPALNDQVKVHFTGWTADGKMFDTSMQEGKPVEFVLKNSLKGWNEGLQLMVKGEKRRFWIPAGSPMATLPRHAGMPAGPVVFDVELLDFIKAPPPPTVPADVAAAQEREEDRIGHRVPRARAWHGEGAPNADSTVEVHYSGWTTAGNMFDSSVTRGAPAKFSLRKVIPGWTEGVQLMVVGDRTRFWIPGNLAYGDHPARPGAPAGMLVFDIQLLAIK